MEPTPATCSGIPSSQRYPPPYKDWREGYYDVSPCALSHRGEGDDGELLPFLNCCCYYWTQCVPSFFT